MSTRNGELKLMKIVHLAPVLLVSFILAACGGGGGGSSDDMNMGNNMCSEGQTGTYPDCMDPPPPDPKFNGPKNAMALDAYRTAETKNATDVVGPVQGGAEAVVRAVDGTLTFEDTVANTEDAPNTLTVVMGDPAPDVGVSGWMGSRVMKTVGMDEDPEAGIVYTNIKAPMENKLSVVTIAVDDANPAVIMEADGVASYSQDAEIMGTFRGIAGTFTCGASTCSIDRDGEGAITGLSNWSFESTNNVDSEATQTDDYLYFGAWLTKTSGDAANVFEAFAGGDTAFMGTISDADTTGTATYTGAAAGMYATKELELKDGVVSVVDGSVMAGEFTAKARLTATFGGDGIAVDDKFKINGSIYDFMDGNQALGFRINLVATNINTTSVNTASASHGTTPSTATAWSYSFFGAATAADGTNILPSGIAGVFDAHFADAHVAGGFGATR